MDDAEYDAHQNLVAAREALEAYCKKTYGASLHDIYNSIFTKYKDPEGDLEWTDTSKEPSFIKKHGLNKCLVLLGKAEIYTPKARRLI